jgi:hypothetical protein
MEFLNFFILLELLKELSKKGFIKPLQEQSLWDEAGEES